MRILYILGCGRSGSTLLDRILGNHPEIASFGELSKLVSVGLRANDFCACGERTGECHFWGEVRANWQSRTSLDVLEYAEVQASIECLSLRRPSAHERDLDAYAELSSALFEALGAVSGKSVLVDSSKLPSRARALARIPGLDIHLIHLTRDPKGVAWSMSKRLQGDARAGLRRDAESMGCWRASLHWTRSNLAAEMVRAITPNPSIWLRYEDMTEDPARALESIAPIAGLDMSGLGDSLARGNGLASHHTVAGNRLRMQAQVTVRRGEEWRAMPRVQRVAVDALAWPLSARYGYSPPWRHRSDQVEPADASR